jgi:hypothetical protein
LDGEIALKAFTIPKTERNSVTEGVEEIIFSVTFLIAHAKVLDLIEQMVSRVLFVDGYLVEGVAAQIA